MRSAADPSGKTAPDEASTQNIKKCASPTFLLQLGRGRVDGKGKPIIPQTLATSV
jgi:hypothetical protein